MRWFSRWAIGLLATPIGVVILAVADSTLFFSLPFGIDAAIIILAARRHTLAWIVPLFATGSSLAGAGLTFWMGVKNRSRVDPARGRADRPLNATLRACDPLAAPASRLCLKPTVDAGTAGIWPPLNSSVTCPSEAPRCRIAGSIQWAVVMPLWPFGRIGRPSSGNVTKRWASDPFEPPMPARIKAKQALHMAESLARGEANRGRIALTLFRDKVSDFKGR